MKSKIFCAMVALAMVFSACNKDLPGQLADEGDFGVKKWYYNGEIPAYATSKIDASEFGNYKGDGKFNNGVNVKVIDGVYLSRVVSETNWVADNGNGKVFITFEEPKEGAWDCTGPLYMVVKYKASLNVSVEFDLKACVGLGTIPLDFPEWGPVTQIRYGEKPNEKCCKTTFELRFHRTDIDCYMNRNNNPDAYSINIPAGDLHRKHLFQIGSEVDGGWVTDFEKEIVDPVLMNAYFDLDDCQIDGGKYTGHGWFVMYDNGDTAYPYEGAIIGCPDVIHVFPVWGPKCDAPPPPTFTVTLRSPNGELVFKQEGIEMNGKIDWCNGAYYEAPIGWQNMTEYGFNSTPCVTYARKVKAGDVIIDLGDSYTCTDDFKVTKNLDFVTVTNPCPVETFKVTFVKWNTSGFFGPFDVNDGDDFDWTQVPNPILYPLAWNAVDRVYNGTWYYKLALTDPSWTPWCPGYGPVPPIKSDLFIAPGWIEVNTYTSDGSEITRNEVGPWRDLYDKIGDPAWVNVLYTSSNIDFSVIDASKVYSIKYKLYQGATLICTATATQLLLNEISGVSTGLSLDCNFGLNDGYYEFSPAWTQVSTTPSTNFTSVIVEVIVLK